MQNKEKTCACPSGGFKTMCGGQALIEGIMMRGPKKQAVVVRKPDGALAIRESQLRFIKDRFPVLGLPLIRGMVTFVASMVEGVRALMYSAEFFPEEEGETEEPSRFEAWLERTLGSDRAASFFVTVSVILGIGMSIGLFFLLPTLLGSVVTFFTDSMVVRNVAESLMKLAIFVGYLALCSRMKDIHRVFQYHGAEHKTIFCYENEEPLTVENVKKHSRFHPRCGTSFMIFMLVLGILVGVFIPFTNPFLRSFTKILLIPLVVALGYEVIRFCGRHDNLFTRIISAPGMWVQRITTKEPKDDMIEVAIQALEAVIPENGEDKLPAQQS